MNGPKIKKIKIALSGVKQKGLVSVVFASAPLIGQVYTTLFRTVGRCEIREER